VAGSEDVEARLRALEARLEAVEAVQAIHNLKARYASLVDSRYTRDGPAAATELGRIADEIADLFSEDAVWDGGERLGLCAGRDEIRRRFLEPTLRFTLHYFVMPEVEVTGDRARGRWDILAPVTFGDGRPGWMAGREDDEYVKVEGVWLHSRMKLTVVFMGPELRGWDRTRTGGGTGQA
jgi:hypothetical protein